MSTSEGTAAHKKDTKKKDKKAKKDVQKGSSGGGENKNNNKEEKKVKKHKTSKIIKPPRLPKRTAVPEGLLKKRRAHFHAIAKRLQTLRDHAKKRGISKGFAIQHAEKYISEYRKRDELLRKQRVQATRNGDFFVEPEPRVAFVFRLRGILGVSPKPKKVLQLFRLRQLNNGVFIRLNKATLNMLRLAEPYVTYGYPNLKTIRLLVYKRGHAKINGQRLPLTDNAVIEKYLGKYGIICMEDIVHEIYTCGSHFPQVSRFLWPFKLSNPKGGFLDKGRHYCEGGDAGNREDLINGLVRKML